jgi:phospholipase C
MKLFCLFLTVFAATAVAVNADDAKEAAGSKRKTNLTPIEHVIILMLENRSFDHMLGFLKKQNSEVNGCLPNEAGCSNPDDPLAENPTSYTVDNTAVYQQADPSHSITGTTQQIYGKNDDTIPPTMSGFIASYETRAAAGDGPKIMKCFDPEHVPGLPFPSPFLFPFTFSFFLVIANLTMEYTVFDSWFAGLPGPTMPNRAYAAAATSHGMGTNDEKTIALGIPSKTMFRQIEEMGLDYRIYFELVPSVVMFKDLRHKDARPRFHGLKKFYTGELPGPTLFPFCFCLSFNLTSVFWTSPFCSPLRLGFFLHI